MPHAGCVYPIPLSGLARPLRPFDGQLRNHHLHQRVAQVKMATGWERDDYVSTKNSDCHSFVFSVLLI